MIVKANASYLPMDYFLHIHGASKRGIPIVICVIECAISLIYISSINNRNFFCIENKCMSMFPNIEIQFAKFWKMSYIILVFILKT